jgi:hypothetical protein
MSCRKPCKECPWQNTNQHSLKFRGYVQKMQKLGKVKNHKCHMISKDVWSYNSEVNQDNVCVGSLSKNIE